MTWVTVRMILALFCFIAYYLNFDLLASRQLFFIVGAGVLLVSIVMLYLITYKTTVFPRNIVISGLWTTSLVKIDLKSVAKVEVKPYSRFIFNNPVYNLHKNGKIRFYSGGKHAIWLTDADGLIYVIGTQSPEEFARAIASARTQK